MAKSAIRRHHGERILANWKRFSGGLRDPLPSESLLFGKVFSTDPYDCGNPGCKLCSLSKNSKPKENRLTLKRELQRILTYGDE